MTIADSITSALINDCERLVLAIGHRALTKVVGETFLFSMGVPEATMNGVITARVSATADDFATQLEAAQKLGLPFSAQLRPGSRVAIQQLVKARGMVEDQPVPLMALARDNAARGTGWMHPDLRIRRLSAADIGLHYSIAAEAFDAPVDIFEALVPPDALALRGLRMYVGLAGDQPVTTAIGLTDGAYVGVYDVATPPRFQGRGYGAAVTARAVVDGFDDGAAWAYLQSSPMGLRVYERLGFRTLESWSVWLSDRPSHS